MLIRLLCVVVQCRRLGGLLACSLALYLCCTGCGTEPLLTQAPIIVRGILRSTALEPVNALIIDSSSGSEVRTSPDGSFELKALVVGQQIELAIIIVSGEPLYLVVPGQRPGDILLLSLTYDPLSDTISIEPGVDEPLPNPTPPSTGPPVTPSPTATPSPSGAFDEAGNTTSFGIPSGLVGNVARGRRQWRSLCASCHGERGRDRSYRQLKRAIENPPMNLSLSNKVIADLTAYLNRKNE